MPSTKSRTVSADFDSSTVITPSLPTFSIASAIKSPIVLSLFEAIVATWAISFLSFVDLLSFFSSSVTAPTAASIPRLSPIGLAPAVTLRSPSRKIACASTVAVVVPSPATSEVLEATSFSIWAPMFSYGSLSSISLATVTPSLVIVGLPNLLSMTTLRPFGPNVAFTAAAMMLIPFNRLDLASSSNFNCFGMGSRFLPYSRMARTSSSRMIRYSLSSIFTSEPEYFPKRILSPVLTSSGIFLPSSLTLPLPAAITLASCGFSLAVSGMMIPPFLTSFSSSRSTRMRSCNGRIFMCLLPPVIRLPTSCRYPASLGSRDHDGLSWLRDSPLRAYARASSESIPSHASAICRLIRGVRDPICRHPNKLGIRGVHADRPDPRGPRRCAVRPGGLHAQVVLCRRSGGARLHGGLRVPIAGGEIGLRRRLGIHADRRRDKARHDGANKSTRHFSHGAPPESSHNNLAASGRRAYSTLVQ